MSDRLVPVFCPYSESGVMVYVVAAGQPTLIDTGGPQHPRAEISAALATKGFALPDVRLIVNTHGHWDHAGGNNAVRAASGGVEVWIHERGAPLLTSTAAHLDDYYGETARLLGRADLSRVLRLSVHSQFEPGPAASRLFRDGERLDLGDGVGFDVIHIPGHSVDSCALYWEAEGILIAGDAAQGTGSRLGACPLYIDSTAAARASIRRLLEIPFRTLHVSHRFGRAGREERPTTYDAADGRAFLSDSLRVLDLMEAALAAGHDAAPEASFPEVARAAVANLEAGGHWPLRPEQTTGLPPSAAVTFHRLGRDLGYW